MCRSGAYAPCAYPRICSNCASACFHILGFIPWPGPRTTQFSFLVIPWLDHGIQVIKLVAQRHNICTLNSVPLSLMCRSGAYAPCAYPRICSNCASACFHILGFIPWSGPRVPFLSSRGPGPALHSSLFLSSRGLTTGPRS